MWFIVCAWRVQYPIYDIPPNHCMHCTYLVHVCTWGVRWCTEMPNSPKQIAGSNLCASCCTVIPHRDLCGTVCLGKVECQVPHIPHPLFRRHECWISDAAGCKVRENMWVFREPEYQSRLGLHQDFWNIEYQGLLMSDFLGLSRNWLNGIPEYYKDHWNIEYHGPWLNPVFC